MPELSDIDLQKMYQIGLERHPNEACGLLLTLVGKQTRVVELPNRSLTPLDGYILDSEDMKLAVSEIDGEVISGAAWHTHPQGLVGPSQRDMKCRPDLEIAMLVVAITDEGPIPSWF